VFTARIRKKMETGFPRDKRDAFCAADHVSNDAVTMRPRSRSRRHLESVACGGKRSTCWRGRGPQPLVSGFTGSEIGRLRSREFIAHIDDRLDRWPRHPRKPSPGFITALGAGFLPSCSPRSDTETFASAADRGNWPSSNLPAFGKTPQLDAHRACPSSYRDLTERVGG